MSKASLTYLYCIVKSAKEPHLSRVHGLPGAGKPRAIDAGRRVWLVVSDAPAEAWGEGPIEAGLQDIGWVSERAAAHERVVEAATRLGGVVPMKLFTIFAGDARALAHVAKARKTIDAALDRVSGCEEWGVRVHFDPEAARAAAPKANGGAASGRDFLLRKKQQHDVAKDLATAARAEVTHLFDRLAARAKDARRRPLGPTETAARVLLDAAFLVPSKKVAAFRKAIAAEEAELEARGLRLTVTGPWPAYNFVGASR